jgi:carboxyl-terminal processing protease
MCALLGGVYGRNVGASPISDNDVNQSLQVLARVYAAVEENYADPVDPDKAVYNGAIQGMLRTLDPHSNFFDRKSFQLLREEQRGRYYGVGMQVAPRGGKTIVLAPFVGSPAYRAGLRPGDIIAQVDGKPTDNLTTTEVAEMLKGPKGTTVRIQVLREGAQAPLEFAIIRDEIPRFSIEQAYEIRPGIGFVRIASFSETTTRELENALRQLDQRNLKGLVLDLRGNPGGLLTEGVSVADKFLAKGQVIVSHRGRASGEKIYRANNGNGGIEYPLVIIINRQSASAAEIVAGAVQDHDRGLVVGETSFGKGLVQTVYPLSDNTGLALTTAKYYTPSGRLIQREFSGMSLYDYYYYRDDLEKNGTANRQMKTTDSGRTVYGGGGITPDEKVVAPPLKGFLRNLELQRYAFFNFAKYYLARHNTVARTFEANDAVITEFRQFLDSEKIPHTEADITDNLDVIKRRIKQELFVSIFGKIEGDRVALESDPQVAKAIELLPKAKVLAEGARRVLAQRR